jgi:hypothetical protein
MILRLLLLGCCRMKRSLLELCWRGAVLDRRLLYLADIIIIMFILLHLLQDLFKAVPTHIQQSSPPVNVKFLRVMLVGSIVSVCVISCYPLLYYNIGFGADRGMVYVVSGRESYRIHLYSAPSSLPPLSSTRTSMLSKLICVPSMMFIAQSCGW